MKQTKVEKSSTHLILSFAVKEEDGKGFGIQTLAEKSAEAEMSTGSLG